MSVTNSERIRTSVMARFNAGVMPECNLARGEDHDDNDDDDQEAADSRAVRCPRARGAEGVLEPRWCRVREQGREPLRAPLSAGTPEPEAPPAPPHRPRQAAAERRRRS